METVLEKPGIHAAGEGKLITRVASLWLYPPRSEFGWWPLNVTEQYYPHFSAFPQ